MYSEAIIERDWRYSSIPWSSKFGDALGCRDGASLKMHPKGRIECDWGYALEGSDRANMVALMEQVWTYN
jgi:hypothetical protein